MPTQRKVVCFFPCLFFRLKRWAFLFLALLTQQEEAEAGSTCSVFGTAQTCLTSDNISNIRFKEGVRATGSIWRFLYQKRVFAK